jgi:predicted TIM-barrel fold metal-dependent hydrolase
MFDEIHSAIKQTDVIDIHVHIGGPPGENDAMYFWSEDFTKSNSFAGMRLVTRLNPAQVTAFRYLSVLFKNIKQSKHVDKIVLLALDQVYSQDGGPHKEATHLFVSNEYVAYLAQLYDEFLYGCSVHPYSPDAIERVWHCARDGAVLCKWLPSSQSIDPTHPLSVRFYHALARLNLPLLIHVGSEETIPGTLNKEEVLLFNAAAGRYGATPGDAIFMALNAGASVIVAHSGIPLGGLFDNDNSYWEKVFDTLLQRLSDIDPSLPLFADTSAFCLPGRFKYIQRIIPIAREMPERFLYGSDYPIPIISFSDSKILAELLEAFEWLAGRAFPANDFDKNFQLLKPHFAERTFTSAARVLRNPQSPVPALKRYLSRLGVKKSRWMHY